MIPKCTILDVAAVLDPPLAFIEIYESLIRSFKSLARGKDFYAKKRSYYIWNLIVLELTMLPFCYQLFSLVISTVSISVGGWLITGESCLLRSFLFFTFIYIAL